MSELARRVSFAGAVALSLATAIYGVLSAQSFILEQFLRPGLSPALVAFADRFGVWVTLAAGAWIAARMSAIRRGPLMLRLAAGGWVLSAAAGWRFPLSRLDAGVAPWGVALVAGVLTCVTTLAELQMTERRDWAVPASSALGDVVVWVAACLLAAMVDVAAAARVGPLAVGDVSQSLRLHLVLAMVGLLFTTLARGLAWWSASGARGEATIAVVGVALVWGTFLYEAMASIAGRGLTAIVVATMGALTLVLLVHGRGRVRPAYPADGVRSALAAWAPGWVARPVGAVVWVGIVAASAIALQEAARVTDWNGIASRLIVLLTASALLGLAAHVVRVARDGSARLLFAGPLVVLVLHLVLSAAPAPSGATPLTRWVVDRTAPEASGLDELFTWLPTHTNLPASASVHPADVTWADLSGPPSPVRPYIFLIVVDSLRRDYLSPFNAAVDFTPAIDALARESLVFSRAFTQYGATGLSIPSLWVGGPVLHRQYVTPFAPMNALARLLAHEQYETWVSPDNIVDVIVPAPLRERPLDDGVLVRDFRLCGTLEEVTRRMADRAADAPPLFVYTLPQDIHVSTLTREGNRPVDDRPYDGFHAPVASRVRRLDDCLGQFIQRLKAGGWYDNSLIILTSDHGDSLGEGGRMGHAYTIYPEIVQVPLLVRVPAVLMAQWAHTPDQPAFTSDLTPTLYRWLGHRLTAPADWFGSPLVFPRGTAPPPPRDRMVASSYGSVYGAVLDAGRTLYVVDAMRLREQAFALGAAAEPSQPLTPDARMRRAGEDVIRTTVEGLARAHGYLTDRQQPRR